MTTNLTPVLAKLFSELVQGANDAGGAFILNSGDAGPFADAKWDEAWKISTVDDAQWREIRGGLAAEARSSVRRARPPRSSSAG